MSDMAGSLAMVRAVSDERLPRTILDYAKKMFLQTFGSPLMLPSRDD